MIKNLFKQHIVAVVIAFALGLATGLPQIIGAYNNPVFAGIYPPLSDDDEYHIARSQEVVDEHPLIANPYFAEYKNNPTPIAWLPEFIFGFLAKISNARALTIYIVADFILPPILMLLSYATMFSLTNDRRWSLLGSSVLHAGFLFGPLSHPISPQFNLLFLLSFFWCIVHLTQTNSRRAVVLGGTALGFMINTYFFYWTYIVVLCGLFIAICIFRKSFLLVKRTALMLGIGLLLGIPNFYFLLAARNSPLYEETVRRFGALATHFPSGLFIIAVSTACIIAAVIAWRKKMINDPHIFALLLAGSGAVIIAANQHVITGLNILFSSHYRFQTIIWSTIAIVFLLSRLSKRISEPLILSCTFGVVVFVGAQISTSAQKQVTRVAQYTDNQRFASTFNWLRTHTEPDSVVFTRPEISLMLPIYTSNNVVVSDMATMSLVSEYELIERFTTAYYFEPFTSEFIEKNQFSVWGAYHVAHNAHTASINRVRNMIGLKKYENPNIPMDEIKRLAKTVSKIKQTPLAELLKKYNTTHVIIDHSKDALQMQKFFEKYPKVFSSQNISVYKF